MKILNPLLIYVCAFFSTTSFAKTCVMLNHISGLSEKIVEVRQGNSILNFGIATTVAKEQMKTIIPSINVLISSTVADSYMLCWEESHSRNIEYIACFSTTLVCLFDNMGNGIQIIGGDIAE